MSSIYLGVDVGGSGIKSALVNTEDGETTTQRVRVDTPDPATPSAVGAALADMVAGYDYDGPVGVGFPSVIRNGAAETANNIDPAWIGVHVPEFLEDETGRQVSVINDADAAAVAEARFGIAAGVSGVVLTITFGTGIGSGLLVDGELVPNLELGRIELDGHVPAEDYYSAKSRRRDDLSWDEWGARANRFLQHIHGVFSPDLIVMGGGLSKHWDRFRDVLDDTLGVVPATMGNNAGLIGAALVASTATRPQTH